MHLKYTQNRNKSGVFKNEQYFENIFILLTVKKKS